MYTKHWNLHQKYSQQYITIAFALHWEKCHFNYKIQLSSIVQYRENINFSISNNNSCQHAKIYLSLPKYSLRLMIKIVAKR